MSHANYGILLWGSCSNKIAKSSEESNKNTYKQSISCTNRTSTKCVWITNIYII